MINFRKITEDNFDAIVKMNCRDGEKFVASNVRSLAQAWLYRDNGDVFPFAIYNDDTVVGFMLLEEDAGEDKLMLWRMMIALEQEGKGYGNEAVKRLIALAAESKKYEALYLDCNIHNSIAKHIYEKNGFVPTGDINHGDMEMKYQLRDR